MLYQVTLSSAINACAARWQIALWLLSRLHAAAGLNEVVLSAAVSACERVGQWKVALDLLSRLWRTGAVVDEILYISVISACSRSSEWRAALQLMSDMAGSNIVASEISISSAVGACHQAGQFMPALHLMSKLNLRTLRSVQMPPWQCARAGRPGGCKTGPTCSRTSIVRGRGGLRS